MESYYSLIKKKSKLEALTRFSVGSGTIFQTPDQIYAFPRDLEITIADRVEAKGEMGVSSLLEARRNIKTYTFTPEG
jgi:hypothetical protein